MCFYTLQDSLHSYSKLPEKEIFKKPLNDHEYNRSTRKNTGKKKALQKLNPTLEIPQLDQNYHHEEVINIPPQIPEPPFRHFIYGPNATPFNIPLEKFSKLYTAIGVIRRIIPWVQKLYTMVLQKNHTPLSDTSFDAIVKIYLYAEQIKYYSQIHAKLHELPLNTVIYHNKHQVYRDEEHLLRLKTRTPLPQ